MVRILDEDDDFIRETSSIIRRRQFLNSSVHLSDTIRLRPRQSSILFANLSPSLDSFSPARRSLFILECCIVYTYWSLFTGFSVSMNGKVTSEGSRINSKSITSKHTTSVRVPCIIVK
jgi:hypothetical protein